MYKSKKVILIVNTKGWYSYSFVGVISSTQSCFTLKLLNKSKYIVTC